MGVGTPGLHEPRAGGRRPQLDARTDIYSLGCVLYEMLAGEPPFTGPTPQAIIARKMTETPRRRSNSVRNTAPAALSQLVDTMVARSAADRPESAKAVATTLEEITASGATGSVVAARSPAGSRRTIWIASRP